MSWEHFEQMADEYDAARPPYPEELFEVLRAEWVIGPGRAVLEVGAGSGLATRELVASGSRVVALEPGRDLADLLGRTVPAASVVSSRAEDADLPDGAFDSVVAATSMHWVDLPVVLPRLHAALRPEGTLAVFRHVFGDDCVRTEFRDRVSQIVARRDGGPREQSSESRPTMSELTAGGWFLPLRSERWRWTTELTTYQVARLFRTFSDWSEHEVEEVAAAADECGGRVTEHYQSVLHLLRRS